MLGMLALLPVLGLWAQPPAGAPIRFLSYSDAYYSFEYPEGWQVRARKDFQRESVQVYLGGGLYGLTGQASGWAVLHIEVFDPSKPSTIPRRGACPAVKIRGLEDYRRELDCSEPQSCRPCQDRKCPRSPVFGSCGLSPVAVNAGAASGWFYYADLRDPTPHRLGPGGETEGYYIFTFPGDPAVYRMDFDAPAGEFTKHLAEAARVLATFRPKS